jgi:prephenate dehydratase
MRARGERILGALGGPWTFGGQAAADFLIADESFASVTYVPTVDELYATLDDGTADAICVPEQTLRTGFHVGIQSGLLDAPRPLYVLRDLVHAYHCSLLLQDEQTPLAGVQTVLGHTGSLSQCGPWLAEHLPDAEVVVVHTNSLEAARTVLAGDGTIASVGTPSVAEELGLHQAALDIDGGSTGNYWALSATPELATRPDTLVVSGRFDPDVPLGDVVAGLHAAGARLVTAFARPSGTALFEYDHVLRFRGAVELDEVERQLAVVPTARLVGAYTA